MFYDNFLKLCNKKGVSPTSAVIEMGFQRSVVTRWKKSIPTDANKLKIAQYFGITVKDLMSDQEEKPVQNTQIRPKLRSVARLEETPITSEQDKEIADYIEYLLKKKGRK